MAQRAYRREHYPDETIEECQENIDGFFKFMHERHLIWRRRFIKNLPREKWTNDHILKTTKYTNIYRQLDRGSLWHIENIMKPYLKLKKSKLRKKRKKGLKNFIWQTIIYRLCNRIETFEEVGLPNYYDFDPEEFYGKLKVVVDRGQSVMTSAHLTCPTPKGLKKYEGYLLAIFDLYKKLDTVYEKIISAKYANELFYAVKSIHAVGGFIAYEVYCDFCYAKLKGFTTNDFVNVGPGATEALKLLYPSTKGQNAVESRLKQLHRDQDKHFKRLGIKFKWYNNYEPIENQLSLRSIEHSLCEYSKYWLQTRNLGKKRMIFSPDSHNSILSEGGCGVIINPNDDWKTRPKRSIPINNTSKKIIRALKQEGLSILEIKEFIGMLKERAEQ